MADLTQGSADTEKLLVAFNPLFAQASKELHRLLDGKLAGSWTVGLGLYCPTADRKDDRLILAFAVNGVGPLSGETKLPIDSKSISVLTRKVAATILDLERFAKSPEGRMLFLGARASTTRTGSLISLI